MREEYITLSSVAQTLVESENRYDSKGCRVLLLFPFLEALGYSSTNVGDIVLNPFYSNDGRKKIDYGLRGLLPDSIKTAIKVIEYDADPNTEIKSIVTFLPKHLVEYVVVTDCFNFYIYTAQGEELSSVAAFNLCSITDEDQNALNCLHCPSSSNNKQEYAVEVQEHTCEESTDSEYNSNQYIKCTNKTEKESVKKRFGLPILPTALVLGLVIITASILLAFGYRANPSFWHGVVFEHSDTILNYHELKGQLSVLQYRDQLSVLQIKLTGTNLSGGSLVSLELTNTDIAETQKYILKTNAAGEIAEKIDIPQSWKDCNIYAISKLDFSLDQPVSVKEKFGDTGENIVGAENVDRFTIAYATLYYDDEEIRAYIKQIADEKAAAELAANRDFLSKYTIVRYANGDMSFYPYGYDTADNDTANNNITAENKAYAKIDYNSTTGVGTLFFCIGTIMKSPSWHQGVFILSDSHSSYELRVTNGVFSWHKNRYGSIVGWCKFDKNGVAGLTDILRAIYSADNSYVQFKYLNETTPVSKDDKNAVMSILALYERYFSNGPTSIDPAWINP